MVLVTSSSVAFDGPAKVFEFGSMLAKGVPAGPGKGISFSAKIAGTFQKVVFEKFWSKKCKREFDGPGTSLASNDVR